MRCNLSVVSGFLLVLVAGLAGAQECPYSTVQARVHLGPQDPWKSSMIVAQGTELQVGAFQNNSGSFVGCCTRIEVTAPDGFRTVVPNEAWFETELLGAYSVRATCGTRTDVATVHVTEPSPPPPPPPVCPAQARVKAREIDPWTSSLNIVQGQRFRVAAVEGSALSTVPAVLQVTGPQGYSVRPGANGVYVDAPYAGRYTLQVTCGSTTTTATVRAEATSVTTPMPQRPNLFGLGMAWGSGWFGNRADIWDEASLEKIMEAGGTAINPSFNWAVVENQEGVYDWSTTDHQVAEAEARGLQMFSFAGNTPTWALPPGVPVEDYWHRYPPYSRRKAQFKEFFRTVASRYCGRVRYYQFWNESNGCSWKQECGGNNTSVAAQEYTTWLNRWYKAMKQGCPDVVLAIGGLDCNQSSGTVCADYLSWVIQHGGLFDAVSIHPYGNQTNPSAGTLNYAAIDAVTRVLQDNGQGWKPLWIDEWGYLSNENGAAKAAAITEVLTHLPQYPNVFQARYLTVSDFPNENFDPVRYGLCKADFTTLTLTPRPAPFAAFREAARGTWTGYSLHNAGIENNRAGSGIDGWGSGGITLAHADNPKPNNQNLGRSFGSYDASGTVPVAQLLPRGRFQSGMRYRFRSWAHGSDAHAGTVRYEIGYAAVEGDIDSFVLLKADTASVGNTWFRTKGVRYEIPSGAGSRPEIGRQIIVRLGNQVGAGTIWFDDLQLEAIPVSVAESP